MAGRKTGANSRENSTGHKQNTKRNTNTLNVSFKKINLEKCLTRQTCRDSERPTLPWPESTSRFKGIETKFMWKNHSYVWTTKIVQQLHPTSAASQAQPWPDWRPDLLLSIPWKDSFLFPCQLSKGIHCLQVLPEPFHLPHRSFSARLSFSFQAQPAQHPKGSWSTTPATARTKPWAPEGRMGPRLWPITSKLSRLFSVGSCHGKMGIFN